MASRGCSVNPDSFCYICSEYLFRWKRRNFTDFVKKSYYAFSVVKLGDQDKTLAPHKWAQCVLKNKDKWQKGRSLFLYDVPMVWSHRKITVITVTFAQIMCKDTAQRQGRTSIIQIFPLYWDLFPIDQICRSHDIQKHWEHAYGLTQAAALEMMMQTSAMALKVKNRNYSVRMKYMI